MRTLGQITARLRCHRPTNVEEILVSCNLPLLYVGAGCYRSVYEIVGSGFVVKVPTSELNQHHAMTEYNVWRKIIRSKRKYAELIPFMPTIRFFSPHNGFTVMDKYATEFKKGPFRAEIRRLDKLAAELFNREDTDLHTDNFGLDAKGRLRMIDLGYFSEEGV